MESSSVKAAMVSCPVCDGEENLSAGINIFKCNCDASFPHHTKQQVQFDRYLSSPDTLVMPQLNFLLSAAIK